MVAMRARRCGGFAAPRSRADRPIASRPCWLASVPRQKPCAKGRALAMQACHGSGPAAPRGRRLSQSARSRRQLPTATPSTLATKPAVRTKRPTSKLNTETAFRKRPGSCTRKSKMAGKM